MAEPVFSVNCDVRNAIAGLEDLGGRIAYSLARSMSVAAGQVLRDQAKQLAPVGTAGGPLGAQNPGLLRDSIYLAFRERASTTETVAYGVTWNARKAPHGHLVEFGHWRYNLIIKGVPQKSLLPGKKRGKGPQDHGGPGALEKPKWVAAHPFLRPAMDVWPEALQVAYQRAKVRFPELLREAYIPPDSEFV